MKKKLLPLGTSDFKSVIEQGKYYVDKTDMITEIISGAEVTLLPRPRRFGKTLNMSMLKYFFCSQQNCRDLFDGLAVANDAESMAHYGQYPVVFLSFKDVKQQTMDSTFEQLRLLIAGAFEQHTHIYSEVELSDSEKEVVQAIRTLRASLAQLGSSIQLLSQLLHRYYQKPAVIIIDEYDTPIIGAYTHDYFGELVGFLRNLLSDAFKDNPAVFRGVMTGILSIAVDSIFSGLNNIDVCSLTSTNFNRIFGFTEAETEQMLAYYDLTDKLPQVRTWYKGYNFGDVTIYNPWSILHFVKRRGELGPYWLNTSDNAIVRDLIAHSPISVKQELESLLVDEKANVRKLLNEHVVFRDIHKSNETVWNFLLFTGYLRYQDKHITPTGEVSATLSIPNLEVRFFYTSAIMEWFEADIALRSVPLPSILDYLLHGDFDSFSKAFMRFCAETFSYFDVQGKQPERFYHAFVLGMLVHLQQSHVIKSNRESGFGRYDVCVIPQDKTLPGYVFEFKSIDEFDNLSLEQACDAALAQIEEKQYVAELEAMGIQTVHAIAMAFEGKRVMVRFQK